MAGIVRLIEPKIIVSGVRGVTTRYDYQKKVVKPFLENRYNLEKCLTEDWTQEMVQALVDQLRDDNQVTKALDKHHLSPMVSSNDVIIVRKSIIDTMVELSKTGAKISSIDELYRYVWIYGYRKRMLAGHLFADIPVNLKKWKEFGPKFYILSEWDQIKLDLMFKSVNNRVTGYIEQYFQSSHGHLGPKTSADTFREVARNCDCHTKEMLFISNNYKELVAAREAGCVVVLIKRTHSDALHPEQMQFTGRVVSNFSQIQWIQTLYRRIYVHRDDQEVADQQLAAAQEMNGNN